ncbi:MAG TPA: thiolase family protein [Capsulimonadaceae bacterium]|jgi:acetyl-CoA C-acetyltransferase
MSTQQNIYLLGTARTAIGQFDGGLASMPATGLGAEAIRASVERSGIPVDEVDEAIMGNVISAGLGQNPARQAAIAGGLPVTTGAFTVNKVCGSGLTAVMLAAQSIRCGSSNIIIAGGMENMSRSPYLLDKARNGYRLGNGVLIDSLLRDGLADAYGDASMGQFAEACAEKYGFSREQQDDYAIESHTLARDAIQRGDLASQIVPVSVTAGKTTTTIDTDEQPRRFDADKMRRLKAAFVDGGTVTAGNASSINDGAAAVAVASDEAVKTYHLAPQARILGWASASREPAWFTLAPIDAIGKLLTGLSLTVDEVDLFEINEAFAVVALAAIRDLNLPREKVNIHGGAIALGHPLGASGARILVTLVHALQTRGKRIGIAALCIGGGEAVAVAVENLR